MIMSLMSNQVSNLMKNLIDTKDMPALENEESAKQSNTYTISMKHLNINTKLNL